MLGEIEGLAHWTMIKVLTVVSVVYTSHHNMPKYHPLLPPHNSFKSSQPQLVLYLHTPSALPPHSVCSKYCQFQLHSNITSWKLCSASMRIVQITHTASGLLHILAVYFPEAPPTGSFANDN